jgi:hypothetical protein
MAGIGTLKETQLHAALKAWYAGPGDSLESRVDGYVVDILRGEAVIEIQTRHFSAIRTKLECLLETRPVRLVYPIVVERWIVRLAEDHRTPVGRRKSPRRGCAAQVFNELVSFPALLAHPNLTLEILLIREEEMRCPRPAARRGRWRKDWRVSDRRLLEVAGRQVLAGPADCAAFLPAGLARPFTNRDLARAMRQPPRLASRMTYCLQHMGALVVAGKQGRATSFDLA